MCTQNNAIVRVIYSLYLAPLFVIMENESSQVVPVHAVPVHAVPVHAGTDIVLSSSVLPTRQSIGVSQNVEIIQEEATSGDLTLMSKEIKAQQAAVLVKESADGKNVMIKGIEVGVLKREVAIEVDGNQVAHAELQYMFVRAFEAHLSRRHPQLAIGPEDEPPPYEPTGFETTAYCCCQAYSCDFKGCCNRRCRVSRSDVKRSFEEPETIKKSRPIGLNVIKDTFLNFLALSLLGEAFLYFTLILASVELILSLVSLITNFSSDQNDQILEIISFVLSVLGTGFSFFDFGLHFRHRGCRIFKRAFKGEAQEQEQDEEHKEFCNDTCVSKSDKKSCGNYCVSVLDIIRIFVLETIYYPDLLSKMFEFIDELINNNHNAKQIPAISWLSFIWSMLLIVGTVYCAKIHTLWGLVYSMKELRIRKKNCEGILFIVTFALYMLGLLILQVLMIAVIGGRYHHDFTAGPGIISGQLWYMMVCGYLMPVFGMAIFFVVHHFWTMKLPLDLIFDFIKLLQTEGIETDNTKKDEEEKQKIRSVTKYIDNFEGDYSNLKKIPCTTKIGYPFSSPLHIVLTSIYSAMLFVFCLCSLIGGPNSGPWVFILFIKWVAWHSREHVCSGCLFCVVVLCIRCTNRHTYGYWHDFNLFIFGLFRFF